MHAHQHSPIQPGGSSSYEQPSFQSPETCAILSDSSFSQADSDLSSEGKITLRPHDVHTYIEDSRHSFQRLDVPLRYPNEVVELLADYYHSTADETQLARLAAALLFPAHPHIQQEYMKVRAAGGDSTFESDEILTFQAYSLFPYSEAAARLWIKYQTEPESFTIKQRVALYAHRAAQEDHSLQRTYTKRLAATILSFHKEESGLFDEELRTEELLKFVKAEIADPLKPISSNTELADLFALTEQEVEKLIENRLAPREHRLRFEKQILHKSSREKPFEVNSIVTLRHLCAVENDLHKSGVISRLSAPEDFAHLFGITTEAAEHHLRYLHLEDATYRRRNGSLSPDLTVYERLLDDVRASYASGIIEDYEILAERYELAPITVFHTLREGLSSSMWARRSLQVTLDFGTTKPITELIEFVKAELSAYFSGELDTVSTDEELAQQMGISPEVVYQVMSPFEQGLSTRSFRAREFILLLRKPESVNTHALRHHLADEVQAALRKLQRSDSPRLQGDVPEHPWRKVYMRGHHFSSYEEAACGLLLEKYIPGFQLEEGVTFQIPMGQSFVDFKVGSHVLEYHPIQLYWTKRGRGSFATREDYLEYVRIKQTLETHSTASKQAFADRVKNALRQGYFKERNTLLTNYSEPGTSLFVFESASGLYYYLAQQAYLLPSEAVFLKEFKHLVAKARLINKR